MLQDLKLNELHGMSNKEAYTYIFKNFVLSRSKESDDPYIGNTQRRDYSPILTEIISNIPEHGHILDIGGGDGALLCKLIRENSKRCQLTYLEPDAYLFNQYKSSAQSLENSVTLGINECVQYLYKKPVTKPADLILASHMIYHLSEINSSSNRLFDDLIEFVRNLYSQLADDGKLVIIYTDCEASYTGQLSLAYHGDTKNHHTLKGLYRARNRLFSDKKILDILQELFTNYNTSIETYRLNSKFYGLSLDVIASMGLLGDALPYNDHIIDPNLLVFSRNYLNIEPHKFGLCRETLPGLRKGLWKVNQPQVVCVIQKT